MNSYDDKLNYGIWNPKPSNAGRSVTGGITSAIMLVAGYGLLAAKFGWLSALVTCFG